MRFFKIIFFISWGGVVVVLTPEISLTDVQNRNAVAGGGAKVVPPEIIYEYS